ncbi:MAG: type II toxin-antitoxin system VapC family toxin [Egibacteraceae bacterium]
MTLIVDASALYAGTDANDPNHQVVATLLRTEGSLVTSEAVATEADHLVLTRLGIDVELQFLDDLAEGALAVECLGLSELRLARDVARQYRDLELVARRRSSSDAGTHLHPASRRCSSLTDGPVCALLAPCEAGAAAPQHSKDLCDRPLGLGDASLIVLAHRFHTRRVASFDHRCFRMVEPLQGGAFTVLPADG